MRTQPRSFVPARDFEAIYARCRDPWHFCSSPYERARYGSMFHALSRVQYQRAFEPGCSVGAFTETLASMCKEVIATDVSVRAVNIARERLAHLPNVAVSCRDLRQGPPAGRFDLIVLSEVGYYFSVEQLSRIADALAGALARGGELLAVHWLGHSNDHILHGDEVHETLNRVLPLPRTHTERHELFRMDRWTRP